MIQRVQTIFLLLSALLMGTMLFVPLAELNNETTSYILSAKGVMTMGEQARSVYPTGSVFALLVLTAVLPLATIFLYKKRVLQIRCCVFHSMLILGFFLLFFFYWNLLRSELSVTTTFLFTCAVPVVALVLDYMAIRRIRYDENLVRSADRLR